MNCLWSADFGRQLLLLLIQLHALRASCIDFSISQPSPAPTTAPRAPFDAEAAWGAIRRASERLAAAEAAALETNARVAQSVRDLFG